MCKENFFQARSTNFDMLDRNEKERCFGCGGLHNYNHINSYISNDIKRMVYCQKRADIEVRSRKGGVFPLNLIINRKIVNSKTQEEMFQIITDHIESFNEVNMVTMMHRIALNCRDKRERTIVLEDKRFKRLFESILYISSYPHRYSPLELANLSWSLIKLGINDHILFDYICNESILLLEQFLPISLSILLCSFAKLTKFYKNLYICSIPKILLELDNMEPQQISNIAWSYSKVGLVSPHLFEKLKSRSIEIINKFFPIHISMLCHAFALTDIVPTNLFELVSGLNIHSFTPRSAVHLLWSFTISRFKIPSKWILWICDDQIITKLSVNEVILLATSLSMLYVDGFVQIKLNNIIDYNLMTNSINVRMNIFKAMARRNRDPNNTLIEWDSSIDTIEINKTKSNTMLDPLGNELIWDTIDSLLVLISSKFKSKSDVIDIIWILFIIGKNLPREFYQIIKLSSTDKSQKNVSEYKTSFVMNPLGDRNSLEDTLNASPTSTSASNGSYQSKYSFKKMDCEREKNKENYKDLRKYEIKLPEIGKGSNESLVTTHSTSYASGYYTTIFLIYNIILIYLVLYK
ncbi:hypothetical protein FG386_000648 [Cryptosporidium ryanae]|uniref:uncharacterized protein n=1 Tax=Cryptosporidium ryanae TaxID=515981 RepID=UPI00351AAB5A|nr:hypothetical protein FG386_000648 [Cryptosporidium ryanae]